MNNLKVLVLTLIVQFGGVAAQADNAALILRYAPNVSDYKFLCNVNFLADSIPTTLAEFQFVLKANEQLNDDKIAFAKQYVAFVQKSFEVYQAVGSKELVLITEGVTGQPVIAARLTANMLEAFGKSAESQISSLPTEDGQRLPFLQPSLTCRLSE